MADGFLVISWVMDAAERTALLEFMRREPYATLATVSLHGGPQAATVGIVVSDAFEIFFDTLSSTRKSSNLKHRPTAAMTIGSTSSGATRTVQLEGTVDEPAGPELERLLALYFARFPDGRERQQWPGITYWRIRPTWLRDSDYAVDPPCVREYWAAHLGE